MWASDRRGSDPQCPMRSYSTNEESQFSINNLHFRFVELLVFEITPKTPRKSRDLSKNDTSSKAPS